MKHARATASAMKKLESYKLTKFQRKVLEAASTIPKGKVLTYKQLAEGIGHPRAYRAVGTALKKNPLPIIIPCHRVVRSDGTAGGYAYGGTEKKKRLLKHEGSGFP